MNRTKEFYLPVDLNFQPSGIDAPEVSIINYNSEGASANNRIKLGQNLFSFLLEGEKAVQYSGKYARINPHQFLLLSAGNYLMSEKTASEAGHYRSILIFFDNKVLADFFIKNPRVLSSPSASEDAFLVFEKDAFLLNYIESLSHIIAAGNSLSPAIQNIKLEELLHYLCDKHPGQLQKLCTFGHSAGDDDIIRQAVTANLYHPITVEELAFLCNVSLSTFKRRFAKIYGTSPNKWLLKQRMEKAAYLLKQGEYKASEIYFELGYENLSSFIQSFKQVHGITPKQYQSLN